MEIAKPRDVVANQRSAEVSLLRCGFGDPHDKEASVRLIQVLLMSSLFRSIMKTLS